MNSRPGPMAGVTTSESSQLSMVVLNVDGTVKTDLGVVSYWHRNPVRRLRWLLVDKPRVDARIRAHNQRSAPNDGL